MSKLVGFVRLAAIVGVLALVAASCGGDGGEGTGGGEPTQGGTLTFAASADPVTMDPAYASDGESLRIAEQIYEGLVRNKEGGTEIEPALAESWETSADGKSWTFHLREGVKFHDGTDFNAEAVCFNFNRWYNFKGLAQTQGVSYYWQTVMGATAFADKSEEERAQALYRDCEVKDELTVVLHLNRPSASILGGLSLPSLAIQSPTALERYNADAIGGTEDKPEFTGEYGLAHPTGTGPFKFESFKAGDRTVLVRNEDYWDANGKAALDRLIIRVIPDAAARRQALESKEIDGYDNAEPADVEALRAAGFKILQRPAFNVAYVGFNLKNKLLQNEKIRQAIAHALNREALLKAKYPPGSEVAKEFMPPSLFGYANDVTEYPYDPEKARQLIRESGETDLTLEFWYPTNVSRPYMPDPVGNFQAFKSDLEAVGFRIVPKAADWSAEYVERVNSGRALGLFLIGWTGDFGDPDNFIGTFFQQSGTDHQFGFSDPKLLEMLNEAEAETDQARRIQLYQEANRYIMDLLPGVPYAHTGPYVVFQPGVDGFVPSPLQDESFATVTKTQG